MANTSSQITLMVTGLLMIMPLQAGDIRAIRDNNGTVEFTNADIDTRKPMAPGKRDTIVYKSLSKDSGTVVFSDQKPGDQDYEILRYDCYACNPDSAVNWRTTALNTTDFSDEIHELADKYAMDPALIRAVIHAESGFQKHARSPKGAQGLMQLMPATAGELGVTDVFDIRQNIDGGVRYLASLLKTFDGDIKLATAAYNAGPAAVKKYNGIPPFTETEVYVERVDILYQRYQQAS